MSLFKKFLSFFFICFFSLFLTVLSVKVKAETKEDTLVFDFEPDTAHRMSGSNSYSSSTNTYSQNNVDVVLKYADSITTGTPLNGSANIMGRVAKNTTNSPSILIGPIDISEWDSITSFDYSIKGVAAMSFTSSYSFDNSNWVEIENITSMPTSKTDKVNSVSLNELSDNLYLKFVVSVSSTTGSNRDFNFDDLKINYTYTELPADAPSTNVSIGPDFNMLTSDNVKLTATFNHVAEEVVWSSSNPEVATIDDEGNITAVGMGTTTISVLSDNNLEDSCVVTVYPDNTNEITIATANAIAELTGDTNSPYTYKTRGTVKANSVSSSQFVLKDNTGEIIVYKKSHGFSENEKVLVEGNIRLFNSEGEFSYPTLSHLYTVTFNPDNGDAVTENEVVDGDKISAPANPVKDGFSFAGWFDGSNEFDSNVAITADANYVARWNSQETNNLQDALDNITAKMSCSYKFSIIPGEKYTDTLNNATTGISDTSYSEWTDKKSNSDAVYAGQSAGSNSSIQLRSNNNNSGVVTTTSGGKAKKIIVEWNNNTSNGRTINVYGKNSAYSAATDLYNQSNQGTLIGTIVYGTSTELVINDDYEYIGIRSNSGALYLDSISIDWIVKDQVINEEETDFRLKLGADLDLANVINQLDEEHRADADYGIELSYKETTKFISFKSSQTGLYEDNVNNIKYILISLGTMFDNAKADATTEFTVKPCVKYGGDTYYSNHAEGSKTYSYASMIEAYYAKNETKEAVEPLYDLMVLNGLIA